MPTTISGTKRSTRIAELFDKAKSKKLKEADNEYVVIHKEEAAVTAAAVQKKELQTNRAGVSSVASLVVVPANNQEEDDLGNPYNYDATTTSRKLAGVAVVKQQQSPTTTSPMKIKSPFTSNKKMALNGGLGSTPSFVDHHDAPSSIIIKRSSSKTSVSCILLCLVAIFLWCSVTLIGLLLSERLEHQLEMYQLRQEVLFLQKSEQLNDDNKNDEKNYHHWKELVKNLEWQKEGMMKEFGEKLASLEFTVE